MVVIRNSTARNLFQVGNSGNGRMVNVRGVEIDSVIVENNSFYNFNAGVTTSGGGFVEQLVFNHNTIYNAGNGMTYDNSALPNQTVHQQHLREHPPPRDHRRRPRGDERERRLYCRIR